MRKLSYCLVLLLLIASCTKKSTGMDWNLPEPVIIPESGTYDEPISIRMSCNMQEADIRYTLDGTEPTEESRLFTDEIMIETSDSLYIKARAFKTVYYPSEVTTAYYNVQLKQLPPPVIYPESGVFTSMITVSITSSKPDAVLRYTTDGSIPDIESLIYTGSFDISEDKTIKAFLHQWGYEDSVTATEEYLFIPNVAGWGSNSDYQIEIPNICNFSYIAAGGYHSLFIREDGSVIGIGSNARGQTSVPEEKSFIAVAAGNHHSIALRTDGSIAAWGWNLYGQAEAPPGKGFSAVATNHNHNLALTKDGSIIGWGWNDNGQTDVPEGYVFKGIAAGSFHSLALKLDGSLIGWGNNDQGQIDVPPGNDFIAIAAGGAHSLALRSDGSIIGWGNNNSGQINTPTGHDFIAVAAGRLHSIALREDGSIVHWGFIGEGMNEVPTGESYSRIAAGRNHNIALKQ